MNEVTLTMRLDMARFLYCTCLRAFNQLRATISGTGETAVAFAYLDMALTFVVKALPHEVTHDDDGNPLTGNETNKPPSGGG